MPNFATAMFSSIHPEPLQKLQAGDKVLMLALIETLTRLGELSTRTRK
jgi:hypothetical protein